MVAYNRLLEDKVESLKRELETNKMQRVSELVDDVEAEEEGRGASGVGCCFKLSATSPAAKGPEVLDANNKGKKCKLKLGQCMVRESALKTMKVRWQVMEALFRVSFVSSGV